MLIKIMSAPLVNSNLFQQARVFNALKHALHALQRLSARNVRMDFSIMPKQKNACKLALLELSLTATVSNALNVEKVLMAVFYAQVKIHAYFVNKVYIFQVHTNVKLPAQKDIFQKNN